jgi:excisionase family DNA binding protein
MKTKRRAMLRRAIARGPHSSTRQYQTFTPGSGFVIRRRRPVKKFIRHRSARVKRMRKSPWMYSRHLRKYLGCTLRHVYWLIANRGFPHYFDRSGCTRRYMFNVYEVDAWLRRYRGKGRQLGLRRLRSKNNPRTRTLG